MSISMSDFIKIMSSVEIIDIRSKESYNNNHIPGSKNIMFMDLMKNPSKYLTRGKRYYVYCQQGRRSIRLCRILNELGYSVVNVMGGYESWILER